MLSICVHISPLFRPGKIAYSPDFSNSLLFPKSPLRHVIVLPDLSGKAFLPCSYLSNKLIHRYTSLILEYDPLHQHDLWRWLWYYTSFRFCHNGPSSFSVNSVFHASRLPYWYCWSPICFCWGEQRFSNRCSNTLLHPVEISNAPLIRVVCYVSPL